MRISLICFTLNGAKLCKRLYTELENQEHKAKAFIIGTYAKESELEPLKETLHEWTCSQFAQVDGIIFIGASGIAVRAIAPFLKDKVTDPAVIVMDEKGEFVIPLLSGHIGGANELAKVIAKSLGGVPVITTATDINHKFAVDMFAKMNDLYISSMDYAKGISVAVLNDQTIGYESDFSFIGSIPAIISTEKSCEYGVCISLNEDKKPFTKTLNLIPRVITLGIGCRKGKSLEEMEKVVLERLKVNKISINAVTNVVTIDIKKEEKCLLKFCEKYNLKMETYSAEILEKVPGSFVESDYVKSVTGTGNVCERAARLGSHNGTILQNKHAENGVTVSIAMKDWSVNFE